MARVSTRREWSSKALFLLGGFLALTAWASAEEAQQLTRIRLETEDRSRSPAIVEVDDLYLAPGAVRLDSEMNDAGGPQFSTIFRTGQGFLYVMHDVGQAMLQDRQQSELYAQRWKALQQQALERMGADSEEEMALLEKRQELARAEQAAQAAAIELQRTGETGELNGRPWSRFTETRSGVLAREMLVISWEELGLAAEVTDVFEEIGRFHQDLREMFGRGPTTSAFDYYRQLGGLPLQTRQFDAEGNVVLEARITAIETLHRPAGFFDNPGYPEIGMADKLPAVPEP